MRAIGNTGAISHTRALPIPTKPTGYEQRTPVRSGHKPIQHGTPEGYERHRENGSMPCKDCVGAAELCGTPRGYDRHRRRGEAACDLCLAAIAAYTDERSRARGDRAADVEYAGYKGRRSKEIQHGTLGGYQRCNKAVGGACDECRQAARDYQRNRRAAQHKPARKPYVPPPPTFDVAAAARDYEAGQSIRDLSLAYGVSRETMRRHLIKSGVDIRPAITGNRVDASQVVALYEQGLILSDIADRLGVSYSGAYKALRAAGVAVRDDRGNNQHRRAS